ncbi:unnamed protein product [Allacma fusca]|uniref:F-box domain-containing protein n=1 Tax=Allacma fusca TaxID=39272 RepID=A0A8J2JUQ9_9HEXA|nr:unnamed protein product [Allacma fusca]
MNKMEAQNEPDVIPTRSSNQSVVEPTHPALESSEFLQPLFSLFNYSTLVSFRQVSKAWNDEACQILKEISFVHLCGKTEEEIQEVNELLDYATESNLNTPFKYFFVYVKENPSEGISYLLTHNVALIGLNYHTDGSDVKSDQEANIIFRDFLQEHGSEINQIIYVYDKSTENQNEKHLEENSPLDFHIQLRSLKTFEYWERHLNSSEEDVAFLLEILSTAPKLRKFVTNSRHSLIYEGLILNGTIFEKLVDLHLIDCSIPTMSLVFNSMEKSQLTSLAIQMWSNTSNRMNSTSLQEVLMKVSGTIEEVSMSCIDLQLEGILGMPTCPNMIALLLNDWTGMLTSVTEKMPNLKKLFISDYGFEMDNLDAFRILPHYGVEHFGLRGVGLKSRRAVDIYLAYMDYISLQFPNIKSFALTMDYVVGRLILGVFRSFPQLEHLELQAFFTSTEPEVRCEMIEDVFTGFNHYTLGRLENTPELTRVLVGPCILDLNHLKSLVILQNGLGEMMTENSIKYGISRVSTLQEFTFDLNPNITATLLNQHLSHLNKIVINMDSKIMEESYDEEVVSNFEETIADLKMLMPRVQINYKAVDPLDKFDFRNY